MTDDEEEEWTVVQPFVIVKSKGGPFDDEAFAAGWLCGMIDMSLQIYADFGIELTEEYNSHTIDARLIPQLDLIAMKNGYKLEMKTNEEDCDYVDTKMVKMTEKNI